MIGFKCGVATAKVSSGGQTSDTPTLTLKLGEEPLFDEHQNDDNGGYDCPCQHSYQNLKQLITYTLSSCTYFCKTFSIIKT